MITFLKVYGLPPRQFYKNADALRYLSNALSRDALLIDPGKIQAQANGENANVTVKLNNRSGQCSKLFTVPPIGARAELFGVVNNSAQSQFSGLVQSVQLDKAVCTIQIEA